MKACNKCKMEKPATSEYFHRDKNRKDGLVNICKKCKKGYMKKHYQKNKEKKNEYNRNYYKENRDYHKKYSEEHKEERREYSRNHYRENKEYYRNYYRENPEVQKLNQQRRRARMAQLPHTLTLEEWEDALEFFDYSCAYCGVPEDNIGKEHVIPIVRGGGYTVDNIIPACQSCNSSKHTTDLEEWYVSYRHYDEEKLNKILEYIEVRK